MYQTYGPWATLIVAGQNPQLSTFWRRRLAMLVHVSRTSRALSRRSVALLVAVAMSVGLLPTLRLAPAMAQQPSLASSSPDKGNETMPKSELERERSALAAVGMGTKYKDFASTSAAAGDENNVLADQLRDAESGNYWAKYHVWAAYAKGAAGMKKDPEKAKKWLAELVDGVYLAKFEPVNGFAPGRRESFSASSARIPASAPSRTPWAGPASSGPRARTAS